MPFRVERIRRLVLVAFLTAMLSTGTAAAHQTTSPAPAARPSMSEIVRAVEKVKADPNLATGRTIKVLRWRTANKKVSGPPAWLVWVVDLFRWIDQSARVLFWCIAIVLGGVLAVYLARKWRLPSRSAGGDSFVAPTHVRDIDIRPESLPADIGTAAKALWDRGEHRAALALLYRGMLSRLAHVHGVPIRYSTTEGDCRALAASHLAHGVRDYVARLIDVWQRAVYGHQDAPSVAVYALCDDFAGSLDGPVHVPSRTDAVEGA